MCVLGLRLHILVAGATFNLHTRLAAAGGLVPQRLTKELRSIPCEFSIVPSMWGRRCTRAFRSSAWNWTWELWRHGPPAGSAAAFVDALAAALPGLAEHGCSYREPGGFFRRMREDEGTWLGHVLEHVAIELQNMAGEEVTFGKTRSAGAPGVYTVVYEYAQRDEGIAAGELGLRLLCSLLPAAIRPADSVPEDWNWQEARDEFIRFAQRRALGPSTSSLVRAAEQQRHPLAAAQRSVAGAARPRQIPAAHSGDGDQPHLAHRGRTGQRQGRDQQDPGDAGAARPEAGTGAKRRTGGARRQAHRLSGRDQAVQRQSRPRHFDSAHERRRSGAGLHGGARAFALGDRRDLSGRRRSSPAGGQRRAGRRDPAHARPCRRRRRSIPSCS